MEKLKSFVMQHIITILCAVSIAALFLPFAKVTAEVSVFGSSASNSQSVSGFAAAQAGFLGYLLFLGPVLLIAMNYIKQLEKHKGLLAIIIPAICFVVLIIVFFQARGVAMKASGLGGVVDIEVKTALGLGLILAALSYIGEVVAGAVIYHDFTLDKQGLEKLKASGAGLLENAQGKVSELTHKSATAHAEESAEKGSVAPSKPIVKKSTNLSKTDEILGLIKKLAEMKESGIITEEEFAEKKKQLLEEI